MMRKGVAISGLVTSMDDQRHGGELGFDKPCGQTHASHVIERSKCSVVRSQRAVQAGFGMCTSDDEWRLPGAAKTTGMPSRAQAAKSGLETVQGAKIVRL